MGLTEIVLNPHFQYLVALLRLPLRFPDWGHLYLSSDIEILVVQAMPHLSLEGSSQDSVPSILPLQALIEAIVKADPRLIYRSEDIEWLRQLLERYPKATEMVLGMLFTAAYTMPEMMSTVQLAELRQEPDITWRKRAQRVGEIPGAYKEGNRWLLPCSTLKILGILSDDLRSVDESSPSRYERMISFVYLRNGESPQNGLHTDSAQFE